MCGVRRAQNSVDARTDAAAPRAVDDRRAETAKEDTHLRTFVQVKSDE